MNIKIKDNKLMIEAKISTILVMIFTFYCIFEILGVAYMNKLETLPLSIGLLLLGVVIVDTFRKYLGENVENASSTYRRLFPTKSAMFVAAVYAASIALLLFTIMALSADFPSLLIVQLILLTILWLDNRRTDINLNMLRVSLIFSVIYVSYLLLLTKNRFMEFVAMISFVSWLYLQIKTE